MQTVGKFAPLKPVRYRASRWPLIVATIAAALCLGSGGAFAGDTDTLEAAAHREGEVTWYVASIDAQSAEAAGRAFAAKYGLKTNVVHGSSPAMFQRLTQDLSKDTGNADVFSSVDVGNFATLKSQGALMAYAPANARDLFPPFRKLDKDNTFHATIASLITIAYNSLEVTAEDAPQNWTDLLDPKWSGKIALAHPAFSGFAGAWAVQMNKLYGSSFFHKLEQLKPQVSRSPSDTVNLVASGERPIAVAPIAMILKDTDEGRRLAVQYPTDGSILVATPSAILKNAPHPNAAKLFVEFLLGPEFGNILVAARYEAMRADVKPLPGAKSAIDLKIIRPTMEDITKGVPEVAKIWRDAFRQ